MPLSSVILLSGFFKNRFERAAALSAVCHGLNGEVRSELAFCGIVHILNRMLMFFDCIRL